LFRNAGQLLELNVDHGSDATIVEYEPYEVGPHIIKIVHEDAHIVGSPFTCNVYDAHKVRNFTIFLTF
jgi:hypothetical protein